MNRIAIEVSTLSSGTLAKLCGSNRYEDIERFTTEWALWCNENAGNCKTWVDAWELYQSVIR